jgi:hypothetical protein
MEPEVDLMYSGNQKSRNSEDDRSIEGRANTGGISRDQVPGSFPEKEVAKMWSTRSRHVVPLFLGVVLAAGLGPLPEARSAPVPTVYQAKGLTPDQFRRLPDDAVIEVRGKRFTAGELRVLERRNKEALKAKKGVATRQFRLDADAQRARFLQDQAAKLTAENAKLRALFAARHVAKPAAPALGATAQPTVPTITEIVGVVRPGAALYIKGLNFGYDGEVLLRGLPQGIVTLPLDTANYLFPWLGDGVAVVVPDITGINDTPASIQVNVKNGLGSKEKAVMFYATDDVQYFAVCPQLLGCGQDATENSCECSPGGGFEGHHTEYTLWEEDALGCDQWQFSLANGWVVDHGSFMAAEGEDGKVGRTFNPAPGSTHYQWQSCWWVNGAGPYSGNTATYYGWLQIHGHKGVPW